MKTTMTLFALLASTGLLYACGGGSMLGSSDAEDHKMIPDVVTEDPNPQRPTAGLAVLRANGDTLFDGSEAKIFHGINLEYGDDPLARLDGITAIAETGSNIIRILVRPDTATQNLEAALNYAITHHLYAVLSLDDESLRCVDDEAAFSNAIKSVWLKNFLPIIHQDRYQGNLMINIASGWGPKDIYSGYSTGYKTYIDNYKTAIRAFRKAGFQVPLVIDAPCGTDFYAFDSARGRELLAADEEKNLVLSAHAYGSYWNSNAKIETAVNLIKSQKMPFIISEFGGSNVGERPIKHKEFLVKASGDSALELDVNWQSTNDKLGFLIPLDAPIDVSNTEVSFEALFDDSYIDDGTLGFQMYLRDSNGEYANISWITTNNADRKAWNFYKGLIKNKSSFGWASDNFDITQVAKVGVELIANGKPAEVRGSIKFDNFKIIEAAGPQELINLNFEQDLAGWQVAWAGSVSQANEGAAFTPSANKDLAVVLPNLTGVDFTQAVEVKIAMFVPASHQGSWIWGKFFNQQNGHIESQDLPEIKAGQWNDIALTIEWAEKGAGLNEIGLMLGGFGGTSGAASDPVIVKSLVISGIDNAVGAYEPGIIYHGSFDGDTDNWGVSSWGAAATVGTANGNLTIAPKDYAERIDVQHQNPAKIEGLNFQDPFTLKTRFFIPAEYEGLTNTTVQFYLQDSAWSHHFDVFNYEYDDLVIGGWNEVEVVVQFPEGFERMGMPKAVGFSFASNLTQDKSSPGMPSTPILVDEVIFEGLVAVEKEEVVRGMIDFYYANHFEQLAVDTVEGELNPEQLFTLSAFLRSAPFSWIASTWFGGKGDAAGFDLTTEVSSSQGLTERGEDIVNGKGGLRDYSPQLPEAKMAD